MQPATRRTLLRVLVRLPIVAGIVECGLFGRNISLGGESDQDRERHETKFAAVRIIRLINTIERHHFEAFGHYADLEELRTSQATNNWLDSNRAEKAGLGRSMFATLNFDRKEIVPGWELAFKLKDDRRSYITTIKDSSGKGGGAFSSDQQGIIHEGESLAETGSDEVWQSARLVTAGNPIEVHEHGRLSSFFKLIAFGPVAAYAGCCQMYPCNCSCRCQEGGVPGCYDCGCTCCVWCCC